MSKVHFRLYEKLRAINRTFSGWHDLVRQRRIAMNAGGLTSASE